MARRGMGRFQPKGGAKLDRGRATHGAKWCFVTSLDEMINYAQTKARHGELAAAGNTLPWPKFLAAKKLEGWELFKSQKEAKRWIALRTDLSHRKIRNLLRQVKMPLNVTRQHGLEDGLSQTVGHYIADFAYEERIVNDAGTIEIWSPVVEETKGYEEDLYKWKKRHFEAQYGIPLRQS